MDSYLNANLFFASIFLLLLIVCLGLNAAGDPGNWVMLIIAVAYSWLMPSESPYAFGISIVLLVLLLCIVGEFLEFITGTVSTKKAGGSKRSMWYSLIGSIVGSFLGIILGIPIPIIGSLVSALIFSGFGALLGAYYGEKIEGKNSQEAWKVGISSFVGRVLGSIFKIICGLIALICMVIGMVI